MSRTLELQSQLLSHSQLLLGHINNLTVAADPGNAGSSPESQLLEDFNLLLDDLMTLCSEFLVTDNSSDLAMECEDLVGSQGDMYIPTLSPNISHLGGRNSTGVRWVQRLEEELSDKAFEEPPVDSVFTSYFEELVSIAASFLCHTFFLPGHSLLTQELLMPFSTTSSNLTHVQSLTLCTFNPFFSHTQVFLITMGNRHSVESHSIPM